MKRVTSFEQACEQQGLDAAKVLPDVSCLPAKDQAAITAYVKLCIIQRCLNGDWKPNWADSNECKYYPWPEVIKREEGASGFGLSFNVCDCSYTLLGSRLYYRDSATAKYAFNTFKDLYEDLILIPR